MSARKGQAPKARTTRRATAWDAFMTVESGAIRLDTAADVLERLEDDLGCLSTEEQVDRHGIYVTLVLIREALRSASEEIRKGITDGVALTSGK